MSTNFSEMCRFCMGRETNMSHLYLEENNIIEKVLAFVPLLKILAGDGLPEQACSRCIYRINDCCSFKQLCEESDKSLRQLRTQKLEAETRVGESDEMKKVSQAGNFFVVKVEDVKEELIIEDSDEFCLNNTDSSIDESQHNSAPADDRTFVAALLKQDQEQNQNQVFVLEERLQPCSSSTNSNFKKDTLTQPFIHDPLQDSPCSLRMSESSDDCEILEETQDEAKAATSRLLPEKSKSLYDRQYVSFIKWCEEKQIVHKFSETVILAYFSEKSKIFKSSTLLATYSMLKSTIALKENVDISKFEKLKAFLKRKATGYTAKKAKTFSRQEISKFLLEAPDMIFLLMKVILLMGLAGACRRNDLANIKIDDIEDKESFLIVRIPYSKSNTQRTFVIPSEEENGVNPAQICRKYAALRPRNIYHRRFFLQYRNGKCSVHALGINQFAKIPSLIAKYLELPDPESYTGRTFRRSATLLVGSGADLIRLKSHGGRRPSNMMRGILEDYGESE